MTTRDAFGARLRRHRQDRGLSQEDLAYASGLSVRAIRNAELGRVRRPRRSSVRRLAEALHLSQDDYENLVAAARSQRILSVDTRAAHQTGDAGPLADPGYISLCPDSNVIVVLPRHRLQPPCFVEIDLMTDDRDPGPRVYVSLRLTHSGVPADSRALSGAMS